MEIIYLILAGTFEPHLLIPLAIEVMQTDVALPGDGLIRWDNGIALGILGTITTWLFWKLNKLEETHDEKIKSIVRKYNEQIQNKDDDLKELNDKLLEAFVSVQTTLSIVAENNNTIMDKMDRTLQNHRESIEKLVTKNER